MICNIREVKSRGAEVIGVANSTSNTLFLDRYIEISANSDSGNSISNFLLRILQISNRIVPVLGAN